MKKRTARVTAGLVVGAAVGLTGISTGTAFAAPYAECPVYSGATLISDGICQIVSTVDDINGDFASYELPAGITKLSAVLIGGGGGGAAGYEASFGGGAGGTEAFSFSTTVGTTATTSLTVSAGAGGSGDTGYVVRGAAPAATAGESSRIGFTWNGESENYEAEGGEGGSTHDETPGTSGNAHGPGEYAGGGAAGVGNRHSGGAGYASFANLLAAYDLDDDSLWDNLSSLNYLADIGYGGDGQHLDAYGTWDHIGPESATPRGAGAGGTASYTSGEDGEEGVVVIRFAYAEDEPQAPTASISQNSVQQGENLTVTVTNLNPSEVVTLAAESKRVEFGTRTADGTGKLVFTFRTAAENFSVGNHTFFVTRADNSVLTLAFRVTLPPTGSADTAPMILSATGALCLMGVGLIALRRRKLAA